MHDQTDLDSSAN